MNPVFYFLLTFIVGFGAGCAKAEAPEEEVVVVKEDKLDELVEVIKEAEKPVTPEDVQDVVAEIIPPTEYVLPEEQLLIMLNHQRGFKVWAERMSAIDKEVELLQSRKAVGRANQNAESMSIKHTLRTFLATQGVPFNELENWKVSDDGKKAVLK
tara:strand:+ start:461 stop:925 length:465 start_codon:yes stop_codon:yes gene_type:complete